MNSAWTIDENKNISTHYVFSQLILNDAAQWIKAFTHIGFFAVKMITTLICEMNDAAHLRSSFKNEAFTGW